METHVHGAVMVKAMLAGALLSGAAFGGSDPELDRVVKDLGAADYQVRQSASMELYGDKDFTLDLLEEALKRPDLSAEQRKRLGDAAYSRFAIEPHGALGVQYNTNQSDKVLIDTVFPEFPASATLKSLDVILELDGNAVQARPGMIGGTAVRPLVIARRPGDVVDMKVERDGKVVNLKVTLGDFNGLNGSRYLEASELQESWRVRQRRTGLAGAAPIDTGLTAEKALAAGMDVRSYEMSQRQRARYGMAPSVVAGGRPDAARAADLSAALSDASGMQFLGGNAFVPRGVAGGGMLLGVVDLSGEKIESLQQRRIALLSRMTINSQLINDPAMDKALVFRMKQELNEAYRMSVLVDNEIARREAQAKRQQPAPKDPPKPQR